MSGSDVSWRPPPHVRRTRSSSVRRVGRRASLALAVGIAAMVLGGGYAVGAFILGSFLSTPSQISAAGVPQAPPGVSAALAEAQIVNATTVPATGACTVSNVGTQAAPTALTNDSSTGICLSTNATGFGAGDLMYILELTFNHTAAVSTEFEAQIAIDMTPSSHDVFVSSFVKTSANITVSESAIFAVDMIESGDTGVVSFSVLITEL